MGEYVSASIRIGGMLPANLAAEFLVALTGDRESNAAAAVRLRDMLDDGVLFYDECEVSWGEFEDAELFCREHGLSYIRDTDGSRVIQANRSSWQPGMSGPCCTLRDLDGFTMVSQDELAVLVDALVAAVSGPGVGSSEYTTAVWALRALCRTDIELPPFVIE